MSDMPNLRRVEIVNDAIEKCERCPRVSLMKGDQGGIGGKRRMLGLGGLTETSLTSRLVEKGVIVLIVQQIKSKGEGRGYTGTRTWIYTS
jgi:hypothetical protein